MDNGSSGIIESWSLQDYTEGSNEAGNRENPQHESVNNHGHKFPILNLL